MLRLMRRELETWSRVPDCGPWRKPWTSHRTPKARAPALDPTRHQQCRNLAFIAAERCGPELRVRCHDRTP